MCFPRTPHGSLLGFLPKKACRGAAAAAATSIAVAVAFACVPLPLEAALITTTFFPVVEQIVDASVAPFPSAVGGAAYAGTGASTCARANSTASVLPLTYTMAAQLYGSLGGGILDPMHGCYLDASGSCVAWAASTAEDCGGRAADALVTGAAEVSARARDRHAPTTSAAALASLVGGDASALRYRLSRSLRRTREVNTALDTLCTLVRAGVAMATTSTENATLKVTMSARAAALVLAHHDVVVDKYAVLREWMPWSLGASGDATERSLFVQPSAVECGTDAQIAALLAQDNPAVSVTDNVLIVGALGDQIGRNRTAFPVPERGLLCMQNYYMWSVATVEDSRIRGLHAMLLNGTLSATGAWDDAVWSDYVTLNVSDLVRRSSFVLETAIVGMAMQGMYNEDVNSPRVTALVECTQRAILQAPYTDSGLVPPSVSWCFDRSTTTASAGAVVPGSGFATPDAAAGMPECPAGWSVFDGGCNGTRTCTRCPDGTVVDGTEVCRCAGAATYVQRGGGCVARDSATDPPTFAWVGPMGTTVVVSGEDGDVVELGTLTLLADTQRSDPSAHMVVSIRCDQGLTTFRATPLGTRSAMCLPGVAYQRRTERTGVVQLTGPGAVTEVVTYAETLRLEVVGSAATSGDACEVYGRTGSSLRVEGGPLLMGSLRVLPRSASVHLTTAAVASSGVPTCDAVASTAVSSGVRVGTCRLATDDGVGVFVDARGYRAVSGGVVSGLLSGASVGQNRTLLAAQIASLVGRVGLRVSLLDTTGSVLGRSTWTPSAADSVAGSWQPVFVVPVGAAVLDRATALQVEVLDTKDGSLLGPATAWVSYDYNDGQPTLPDGSSSMSGSGGCGGGGGGSGYSARSDGRLPGGCVAGIVIVCVLLGVAIAVLALLTAHLCWCGGAGVLAKDGEEQRTPAPSPDSVGSSSSSNPTSPINRPAAAGGDEPAVNRVG